MKTFYPFLICCLSILITLSSQAEDSPKPVGPYLQNPGMTGMTVTLIGKDVTKVTVALKGPAEEKESRHEGKTLPIPGEEGWSAWHVRLDGLTPGTKYTYTMSYDQGGKQVSAKPYSFKTFGKDSIKLAAFTDLHNVPQVIPHLLAKCKPEDYEATVLLGDCFHNPPNFSKMLGMLNAYVTKLGAAEKPMIYVRGNHECHGKFAEGMAYFFDLPKLDPTVPMEKQEYYFTLKAGPVYFLMMDVGDEHGNWKAYQERQAEWMKRVIEEKDFKNALWRVGYSHIPLYTARRRLDQPRDIWNPVLNAAKLDLTLSGHTHRPEFIDKGKEFAWTETIKIKKRPVEKKVQFTSPYPTLIGGTAHGKTATVMLLSADKDALSARLVFREGETQTYTWDKNRKLTIGK